jgi:signal transduction histidine kinase
MIRKITEHFFSERTSLTLKITVYSITLVLLAVLFVLDRNELFNNAEWRLLLYVPYLMIFVTTFFCGLAPGILYAIFSSILAAISLGNQGATIAQLTVADLEVFPFITMYFLVAITVDWFRKNIERLQEQLVENKRLHNQARHMEKLALAGEIAAGIAHEIRNPLTVVQGYIQLISAKCPRNCDYSTDFTFTLLLDELKRTNQIISDFLRFSRPSDPCMSVTHINEIVESAVSLLYGETLRKNVQIFVYPAPDIPESTMDRGQMVQVFLNLFSNAMQAMPSGGTISVHTSYKKETEQAYITVADSGTGISSEVQQRIFTPFFTTKVDGTGLGLAITQTIILAHGGQISVESAPGEGTAFLITMPLTHHKLPPDNL